MSFLQWKDEYSVGIESMDDEHREMIALINSTYDKLGSDADPDQIDECLAEIFNTISMHFALEERIMRNAAYAEFEAHKNDHEELLDGDVTLQRTIMLRNPYVDPMSLMQVDLLARWRKSGYEDDDLFNALLASVNGIAQGLQNTG